MKRDRIVVPCAYIIAKKFAGQRYTYSRRRCRNRPLKGKSYCYLHKVYES